MKQQYSSNYDDPFVANQRLKNKLDFLQRQSIKRQTYLKELQRNLKLAKQTIKTLTQNKNQNPTSKEQMIAKLHKQNSLLLQKLSQQHTSICKLNALYLMECQLRLEESKSFNERIKDFEQTMAELRRYLHDKQESFSYVAQKLKRYEELLPNQQLTMYEKLINYSGIVKEEVTWKGVISQILQDRDNYKKMYEEQLQKYKKSSNQQTGISIQQPQKKQSARINTIKSMGQLPPSDNKNLSLQSTKIFSQNKKLSIQPNIQLIRLMKKQKLSNKILQVALTQAIEKNLQLIEYNKKLIEHNENLREETDLIIADMVVICRVLSRYDENYRSKLRILRHQSRCDIELPSYRQIIEKYKNNDLQQAEEIVFTRMRNSVEQLTEYIALCPLKKTNTIRSFESPRKIYQQSQNLDVSINAKQLEISQI